MSLRCGFDTYEISDTMIVLIDRNETGLASVTNQADEVVTWLQLHLNGGIGLRRVYYRDSACTPSQQQYFRSLYYAQQESV